MRPCSIAARYGRSSDSQMARTVPCVAIDGLAAMPAAISWARSHSAVALDDLGHEADAQRGLGADPLVVAHQRHAERVAQADAAHEPDRLERGHHPAAHVRVEERRVGRADHDVGLVDEVEGAGRAHALHRAHHRLPDLLPLGAEQLARILVVPDVVGLAVRLADVEAGAERPVARGAEHDRVDRPGRA